jgi:tetratricopeptide (TPR) repeat protein
MIAMTKTASVNDHRPLFFSACTTGRICSTIGRYRLLYALLVPAVLLAQPSAAPISQWEAQLEKQPDNIDLRSNLIREYFRLSRQDPGAEKARIGHIRWMVTHRPEALMMGEPAVTVSRLGEEYNAVEKVWREQVDKPDVTPQVLANAANFFRPLEPARSIELLAKARTLEPKNQMWTFMLGEMYAFQIVGVTGLNQNGLPIGVDPAKMDSHEAEHFKTLVLGSKDTELVVAVASALQGRGAIAASMMGRQAEIAALAEELLKHGQSLDPRNPRWHGMLAQFYAQQADYATSERKTTYVRKAMEEFNAEAAIDPAALSAFPPSRYARIAVEAGELDKARASAERCLAQIATVQFKDAAIHECNLILGRVALRRGDPKRAGEYLLAAAQVEGKGSLSSFGPNMMLARELLEKGQRDTVLEYFRLCGKFWSYDRGQLARWTAQVKAGEIPQFGANLVY